MARCLYPDCEGDLEPGAPYCDECGRSQAPEKVAAARAGAEARQQAPARGGVRRPTGAPMPLRRPDFPSAAPVPRSAPAPPRPPARPGAAPAWASPPPWPVALGFGILFIVLLLGCMGALAIGVVMSPLVALPPTATPRPGSYAPAVPRSSGSRIVIVAPAPGLLSSPTVPSWAATISRTMASPRPLPPALAGAPSPARPAAPW
jgi:hypothetical protein